MKNQDIYISLYIYICGAWNAIILQSVVLILLLWNNAITCTSAQKKASDKKNYALFYVFLNQRVSSCSNHTCWCTLLGFKQVHVCWCERDCFRWFTHWPRQRWSWEADEPVYKQNGEVSLFIYLFLTGLNSFQGVTFSISLQKVWYTRRSWLWFDSWCPVKQEGHILARHSQSYYKQKTASVSQCRSLYVCRGLRKN